MSLATEVKEEAKESGREPKDVLREWMLFYNEKAKDILITIIACIEDVDERGKPNKRGDLLALMYKELTLTSERAIECATKLAPYKHAKLESIEQRNVDEKRFVVVIPSQQLSKDDWLKNASAIAPPTLPQLHSPLEEQIVEEAQEFYVSDDIPEEYRKDIYED